MPPRITDPEKMTKQYNFRMPIAVGALHDRICAEDHRLPGQTVSFLILEESIRRWPDMASRLRK